MKRQAEGKGGRKSDDGADGADLVLNDSDDDDEVVYVKTLKSPKAASTLNHTLAMTGPAPASQMVLHYVSIHFFLFQINAKYHFQVNSHNFFYKGS